jgi:hypothetical protein
MSTRQANSRILLTASLLTLSFAGAGSAVLPQPALAAEIVTDAPPPPDRIEHAPPPRDGYVWGAGHWEWNGRAYVWTSGTWILARRSAHWVMDRWEEGDGKWHFVPGHWER